MYRSLATVGEVEVKAEAQAPAVPIKKSVFPDFIICLEDGKKLKMLKRHLKTSYNLTPDQYPDQVGAAARLPNDGAGLRLAPLHAGQEDRPGPQAGRGACRTRGGEAAGTARARCQGLSSAGLRKSTYALDRSWSATCSRFLRPG